MKIAALRTAVVGTPWRNLTFVELRTDEGLTGVGEVRMLGHTDALLGYLAEAEGRYVLGADPFAIEALVQRMYRGDYARAGEIAMSAIACVELACWDIVGQALGQPVHRLLGGPVRERINTSGIHVDFMIGGDGVDVTGIEGDGTEVPVLRGGAWQL